MTEGSRQPTLWSPERTGRRRWALVGAVALLAPVALVLVVFACDRALGAGEVLRGVSVGSVSLSGLDAKEAASALERVLASSKDRRTAVVVKDRMFRFSAEQARVAVDLDATVSRAMGAGRSGGVLAQLGWWLERFVRAERVGLVVTLDDAALRGLIDEWEREAIDDTPFAGTVVYKKGEVAPEYPRAGLLVDRPAAAARIQRALAHVETTAVAIPLSRREAELDNAAVDDAVARAQKLLTGPITLENDKEGVLLEMKVDDLGAALGTRVERDPLRLEVDFDAEAIDRQLASIRSKLQEPPEDARFEVDARDRVTIAPSRPGTLVHAGAVAKALLETARAGRRTGELPIERSAQPKFTTADAEKLGIRELISRFTTYHNCCEDRVKNIHRMADLLDGLIVPPGGKFSVNETIGPRTKKKGFVPAPSIADGEMVKTVGGGVSQFATTMFNAIFHGGFHIVERQPHSYYFPRYPVGHEATLSYPHPDLAFENDSASSLLIRTAYGPTHITVKLFGTKDGRKVKRIVSRKFDLVKPPVELEANEQLDPEDEKVQYSGQLGWSVSVSRVVTFADGKKKEEKRKVVYQPRARIVEVHPCKIPEGEEGHTGEECPEPEDAGAGDAGSADEPVGDPESPTEEP